MSTPDTKPPELAMIDYGMGNLRSVQKAFEHVGAQVRVITSPEQTGEPDALILPGVGALGDCVDALKSTGLADTVSGWIGEQRPFFGICLGLQALFEYSEEGNVAGLGIFPGKVLRFQRPHEYKIPHMGWNRVRFTHPADPLLKGLQADGDQYYFVHSYHVVPEDVSLEFARTDYGGEFVCAIKQGACYATQFHPEKSQAKGLQLYRNFLDTLSPSIIPA